VAPGFNIVSRISGKVQLGRFANNPDPMKSSIALLDPLRAFAAWAVIAWHLSSFVGYKMPFFTSAAFAVDVFMNLSGFLMMYHYMDRRGVEPWESPRTWARFLIRRVFRIAPLYYVVLLAVYWFRIAPPNESHAAATAITADAIGHHLATFDVGFLLMHSSFLFGLFPSYTGDNIIPDWSLSLEMQFYACFPFLALLAGRIGTGAFFFVCCLVAAAANGVISYYASSPPGVVGWYPQPSILPLKLHVFAVGIVAANVFFRGVRELRSWWFAGALVLFGLTCRSNYTKVLGAFYGAVYLLALIPAASGHLIALIARVNSWCEARGWFHWPAELSYSGYLTHGIVLALVFGWPVSGPSHGNISTLRFAVTFLIVLLLINILGVALHFVIEKPGINLGKSLLARMLAPRPSTSE